MHGTSLPDACVKGHQMAAAPVSTFIGIEVAILPEETTFAVPNDPAGWAALRDRLPMDRPVTIVLEATGADHRGVTLALAAAGHPPAVSNPGRTHAFMLSEGVRAKTDRSDARLLARFGQQKQPVPSPIEPSRSWSPVATT